MKDFLKKSVVFALLFVPLTISVSMLGANVKKSAPAWTKVTPVKKGTFSSVACAAKFNATDANTKGKPASIFSLESVDPALDYVDSAKFEAFHKFTQILPWGIDKQSLLFTLNKYGITVPAEDIERSLIDLMYDAPEFALKGTWEDDNNYWCYYSITESDFNFFIDRTSQLLGNKALDLYNEGCRQRGYGNPKQAAAYFIKALNTYQPLMFRCYETSRGNNGELGNAILSALLNVYDGITLEPEYPSIPAICGEELPIKVNIKVKQNGIPLNGIVLYSKFHGEYETVQATDSLGIYSMTVKKVVSAEQAQKIHFFIDGDLMFDVGSSIADKLFKKRQFPETEVELKLFDPATYVHVEVSSNSSIVETVCDQILACRKDFKLTSDRDKADLVLQINQNTSIAGTFYNEKYNITTYVGSLSITVNSLWNGETLNTYNISDFKYAVKGERSPDNASRSIARQFSSMIEDDFPDFLKLIKFDKRNCVWQDYQ